MTVWRQKGRFEKKHNPNPSLLLKGYETKDNCFTSYVYSIGNHVVTVVTLIPCFLSIKNLKQ